MPLDVKRAFGPIHVETPNIGQEVNTLLSIHPEVFRSLNTDIRKRIEVLAERFEFINHLETLAKFIEKEKDSSRVLKYTGDGKIFVKEIDSYRLMDQDLSGADYDLRALIFYLLITCIDTIKGRPKYFNPFEWLLNNIDSFICVAYKEDGFPIKK